MLMPWQSLTRMMGQKTLNILWGCFCLPRQTLTLEKQHRSSSTRLKVAGGPGIQSQSGSCSKDLLASGCMEEIGSWLSCDRLGDRSLPVLKQISPMVKAFLRAWNSHRMLILLFWFLEQCGRARNWSWQQFYPRNSFQMFKSWLECSLWTGKSSKSASRSLNSILWWWNMLDANCEGLSSQPNRRP